MLNISMIHFYAPIFAFLKKMRDYPQKEGPIGPEFKCADLPKLPTTFFLIGLCIIIIIRSGGNIFSLRINVWPTAENSGQS